VNLSVGKQKEPISMESIMSMIQTLMHERSAPADALLPLRSFGIVASGTVRNERMSWATGVFNFWVDQTSGFSDNTMTTTGRFTWLPWLSDDESSLFHLNLGLRHSNIKTGLQFFALPEFNKASAKESFGPEKPAKSRKSDQLGRPVTMPDPWGNSG